MNRSTPFAVGRSILLAVLAGWAGAATAQLRVAQWNVTNYSGGRILEFQTAIYGAFEGRSMRPDILIGEEFISQSAVNTFLSLLNAAPGSPADWAAAPFVDGPDTDSAFFYRTSKVDYLGMTIVATGSTQSTNQPRNTYRYDIRLKNYDGAGATLACYASHMKAGTTSTDQQRRLVEAQRIAQNAATLDSQWQYLLGADLNIQTSTQAAYVELVGSAPSYVGPFKDPIKTPGNWNNSLSFRFVHTQDPATAMDDRHDQILVSPGLVDQTGFDYMGNASVSYSTSTWNDPNHTYRSWGNDGTSYNNPLTVVGNTMVGPVIAQALIDAANGLGHLPVFLDLRVPPKSAATTSIDFGTVGQGAFVQKPLQVWNAGDVALWNAVGIANLNYALSVGPAFIAPGGLFSEPAGGGVNTHMIRIDTATPGPKVATLTIASNDPDVPVRLVSLKGFVKGIVGPPGR
ncbi:MAG TPA: hypothetical protein PLL78_13600 [Fimbriimonadaceae bacterium]|nr:hypothetical protein [Fimbriimonadaceae bacterium]HRJ97710.1 hypothetical protein [Fimbriimonadaceae bacterium]